MKWIGHDFCLFVFILLLFLALVLMRRRTINSPFNDDNQTPLKKRQIFLDEIYNAQHGALICWEEKKKYELRIRVLCFVRILSYFLSSITV